jgi:hypothetical protein
MANPPPPYANITGISRTVMKDNAQENIVNYNGNARPGEIVADLTQDPPALYIGNNLGQLTQIGTGGGGNTGNIFFSGSNISSTENVVYITSNIAEPDATWSFGDIYPGTSFFSSPVSDNANVGVVNLRGVTGNGYVFWANSSPLNDTLTVASTNTVSVCAGFGMGPGDIWTFAPGGNLTVPISGNIVGNTANNSGSMQWIGNSSGDGAGYTTLHLNPDDTRIGSDQYVIIDPTAPNHIHIRAGGTQDSSSAQLFLGGETSYVSVGSGLNPSVYISANNSQWTFDITGTLTLPGAAQLAVYANTTVRDTAIASPQPGMMIYVTGTGMQVYGATQWNTIAGSGT